jgi:hypothetical protein
MVSNMGITSSFSGGHQLPGIGGQSRDGSASTMATICSRSALSRAISVQIIQPAAQQLLRRLTGQRPVSRIAKRSLDVAELQSSGAEPLDELQPVYRVGLISDTPPEFEPGPAADLPSRSSGSCWHRRP